MSKQITSYRVRLTNLNSVGTRCGFADGKTLEEAQRKAMELARQQNRPDPVLSPSGYEVLFRERVML